MMSKTSLKLAGYIAAIGTMLYLTPTSLAVGEDYLSPSAMVADEQGKMLYIAEATAKQVAVFDTESSKVTGTIDVPAKPTGLALTANGAYLYVTCAGPQGHLCVIEIRRGGPNKIIRQTPAGYGVCSPVLSPNNNTLYVCNRFTNDVFFRYAPVDFEVIPNQRQDCEIS